MKLPEVPQAKPLATQMEEAMATLPEPSPKGMRRIKEKSKEPAVKASKAEEPTASEPEPVPEPKPEPVTQEKLSHGFAKLARQQKAVQREEARIKAELEKLESAKGEHEKSTSALRAELEKRQADIDELTKLLDEDVDKFADALARRKNLKKDDIYDRWTRQRLNGGVPAPEDQISRASGETEKLRKELEDMKAALKAKEDDASKKTEEDKKRQEYERAVQAENAGFLEHVRAPGKYPLLAKEADADIVNVARQVANGQPVSYDQLAAYLERQLSFQKWQEEQAGKPAEAETPTLSAPVKPEGKKAESSKTLTNKLSQTAPSTRRNDHERIEDIIDRVWK